jgi:hypothetical protein
MVVVIKKYSVSSSNCYKTIKTASIPIILGTNVGWTIYLVTTCSVLNFMLPWQRGTSQNCHKSLFHVDCFPSKLILNCCNFLMDWDKVKGFGNTLRYGRSGVIFSLIQVQTFLGDVGGLPPLQSPQTEGGTSPLWQLLGISPLVRGRADILVTFLNNIFQTKTSVGDLNNAFFHHLRQQQRGRGGNGVKRRVYQVMG